MMFPSFLYKEPTQVASFCSCFVADLVALKVIIQEVFIFPRLLFLEAGCYLADRWPSTRIQWPLKTTVTENL